ncbi:MAG TPA: hypothetical protein VGI74_01670 [Streptosporangiaceae bacterium]|jgi:streptogramin lyase
MPTHSRPLTVALLAVLPCLGLVAVAGPAQAAFTITEFNVPTGGAQPLRMALGHDKNVWFTEFSSNKIAKITTAGTITEYTIPTAGSQPSAIAAGPDGNMWFTEESGNKIGKITTAGKITEFTIPDAKSNPEGIAAGPDGNLWFTEFNGNRVGKITTAGVIKTFALPNPKSNPLGITAGSDGNVWFTDYNVGAIGRITTSGVITTFGVGAVHPYDVAPGSDGNLWITEVSTNEIARMNTAGSVTGNFPIPTSASQSLELTPGPDGALWFTEHQGDNIGQITTGGSVTEFSVPTAGSIPWGIAPGSDGNMWFTEFSGNKIGRIDLPHFNLLNVYYIPNRFFIPNESSLTSRGETVSWLSLNPGLHGIQDSSGMGLFGTPNGLRIGGTYSFTFTGAGTYQYDDMFHTARKGTVGVPISVHPVIGAVDTAQVTWASAGPPAGFAGNVQLQQPGSTDFVTWQANVTSLSATFGPNDPLWAGPGTYRFRAQLENLATGTASGFSKPGSITLP